jgi:hypothetical protein
MQRMCCALAKSFKTKDRILKEILNGKFEHQNDKFKYTTFYLKDNKEGHH